MTDDWLLATAMRLTIASDVSSRVPLLSLGLLSMRGLSVRAKDEDLWQCIEQASADLVARCGVNGIASDSRIVAVRRMFKAIGVDPSRYRPSSEALVRRVVQGNPVPPAAGVSAPLRGAAQGKGLYPINTAVDVNNWGSLAERLPFGIYDAAQIAGDVLLRLGRENEVYEGIGKSLVSLEGKMILSDERGPFGSPISDSTRAMVNEQTHDIHLVVFAPNVSHDALNGILQQTSKRMMQYNGGALERIAISPENQNHG